MCFIIQKCLGFETITTLDVKIVTLNQRLTQNF